MSLATSSSEEDNWKAVEEKEIWQLATKTKQRSDDVRRKLRRRALKKVIFRDLKMV